MFVVGGEAVLGVLADPPRRLALRLSLLLGLLFQWLIPDLGFAWGVALGAIVSPTDAVATSIIKGGPVPRRVVVLLEGEGLLNYATALVMLRTAIVASVISAEATASGTSVSRENNCADSGG